MESIFFYTRGTLNLKIKKMFTLYFNCTPIYVSKITQNRFQKAIIKNAIIEIIYLYLLLVNIEKSLNYIRENIDAST